MSNIIKVQFGKQDDARIIHKQVIHGGTKCFVVFYQKGKVYFSICKSDDSRFTVEVWSPSDDIIGLQNIYYLAFDKYLEDLREQDHDKNTR